MSEPICELLEMWQERVDAHLRRANEPPTHPPFSAAIGSRLELEKGAVLALCISELRRVHLAAGELAPLPGQVLDDQSIDAIDRRYDELEKRVDALERAVSQ